MRSASADRFYYSMFTGEKIECKIENVKCKTGLQSKMHL